jgi:5'/3'-nucleotidase SurE
MRTSALLQASLFALATTSTTKATNIVLTNDDGWATAQIRAQYEALKAAGFPTILSAPAENQSGTGSSTSTPKPTTEPCEFNTCPTGGPAEGSNSSDPFVNYVNGYPVDSVKYGIQTLSPKLFGGAPDFIVSGPNIGTNLGLDAFFSGTMYVILSYHSRRNPLN